jgi:hypothetical protein
VSRSCRREYAVDLGNGMDRGASVSTQPRSNEEVCTWE